MDPEIPYSPLRDDLFNPGRRDGFFPSAQPMSDAVLCAGMARLAYCRVEPDFGLDKNRIIGVLRDVGFLDCRFFESHGAHRSEGVHAFLARRSSDKLTVAAFRGTDAEDVSDVAYDVDFRLEPWPNGGNVHAGFAHALNKLLPTLGPELESIDSHRILFTGHSLGAAMATLFASVRKPDALYTFGCPRVGDATFVATLQGVQSYRYVDCSDMVTRVPPEALGFVHLGKPLYIDRTRKMTFDPDPAVMREDSICAEAEYLVEHAWRLGTVALRGLADHAPINYVWPLGAIPADTH